MYQSSSSSSSQTSTGPNNGGGLTRYVSAPGDFSAIGSHPSNLVGRFFAGEPPSFVSEPTSCKVSSSNSQKESGKGVLQRSYGFNEIVQNSSTGASSSFSSSLFRQRSSPAGFFSQLADLDGFSMMKGNNWNNGGERGPSRSKSQLSFNGQDSLSRISQVDERAINGVASSSMRFGVDSWEGSTSIAFTIDQPNKRPKNGEFFTIDTQFSVPHTSLEMARMESFMHIHEDAVTCKIRAKRGCATHPRSIAERERRTRISEKLKKLQELVPNMDKQTSYADMLDLAVDHIKGLKKQVQKIQKEMENCTCGCKRGN